MTNPGPTTPGPDELLAMMPYATTLGIQLHQATPAQVTGSLAWTPERCTAGGILHGGAIMSLADTIGAVCAYLNLPDGASTATIDSTTRLYRPLRAGTLHATSRPAHIGGTLIAITTDLTDDQDRLIAKPGPNQPSPGRHHRPPSASDSKLSRPRQRAAPPAWSAAMTIATSALSGSSSMSAICSGSSESRSRVATTQNPTRWAAT